MKKVFIKITSIACAAVMFSSLLTACSGTKKDGKGSNAEAQTAGSKAPITLSYVSPDSGKVYKEDSPVIKELEKNQNIKLDMSLIPTAEFTNKFNLMVASSDVPDIVRLLNYDLFQYIPQGIFLDINKMLQSNGSNLNKNIPKEAWDKMNINGKIYGVPSYNWPGKYSFYMRQDWLDSLGLKAPTNLDELEDVLKKFTYNDPDKNGKNDTYGITSDGQITDIPVAFGAIFGAFGFSPRSHYEKDGKVYVPLITPEYKESLAYITKLYKDDKVVEPDIFILKTDQLAQYIVQGRAGSFTGWWSRPEQKFMDQMKMKSVNPNAKWAIVNGIKGKNAQHGVGASSMVTGTASIYAKSKNTDAAFKFLDYLASDEGAKLVFLGVKDVHYTEKDGKFEKRTEEGDKGYEEKWIDNMSQTVYRNDLAMEIYKINNPSYWPYIEACRDNKLYYDLFEGITTPEAQRLGADLKKFELEWFVKFVTGKEPLSKFDEYVKQWKDKGGKEITDSYIKEYNKLYGKNVTASY